MARIKALSLYAKDKSMIVTFDKDYLRELYETGKGDKAGISSIRVNDQYRIEFTVSEEENETIVYICNILELSNHYK